MIALASHEDRIAQSAIFERAQLDMKRAEQYCNRPRFPIPAIPHSQAILETKGQMSPKSRRRVQSTDFSDFAGRFESLTPRAEDNSIATSSVGRRIPISSQPM
jgi:hypothetical protein